MNNELKASLEKLLDKWIDENGDELNTAYPTKMASRLVEIISNVLDYSHSAQPNEMA